MKEIPLRLLVGSVTTKRVINAALAVSSYLLSALVRRTFVWGTPMILTVEPTNVCNLRCPLCVTGNGGMTRPAGFLDFRRFQKIIDEIGDRVFYLLLYQQGEPFLNRDFLRFVEYAKQQRIFVTTSSNAHYFTPETAERTVASGLDSIIVSVDGADQSSYQTYRVGGNLERVKEGVYNLVSEKKRQGSRTPVVYLQFIVMRHNAHQVDEMQQMARQLGVDKFLKKTVQVETPDEARKWLPRSKKLRRYAIRDGRIEPKRVARGPCPRPWTSSLVNWDGSTAPCCFDKNGRHTGGSMSSETSFGQVWKSTSYADFRTKMLRDRKAIDICSNCSQGLRLFI